MNTMYDQIAAVAATAPRRIFERLNAELDVRGWTSVASEHAGELRTLTPASGRGHAVINAEVALRDAERILGKLDTERSSYSIEGRIAQSVMWTSFALLNVDAASAAFDELCARGVGDYDTQRREVPIRDEERAFIACALGVRVGDDVANW